jgi:hypothetical protein
MANQLVGAIEAKAFDQCGQGGDVRRGFQIQYQRGFNAAFLKQGTG